jgi:glycerophosphoryl diester phosphodiesterase
MIGHQGIHHLEVGNTCSGFVAAGNRTYWGIETDVHVTKDGQYIIIHDDNTIGTTGDDYVVEETDCATLRSLTMLDYTDGGGHTRSDLRLPLLSEYIRICRKYEKKAVLEIKNPVAPEHIKGIVDEVDSLGWLENTVFISFSHDNMVELRKLLPDAKLMFLTTHAPNQELVDMLLPWNLHLDIAWTVLTREGVELMHANGIEVNVWNVDEVELAERLLSWGVDYLTTDILE